MKKSWIGSMALVRAVAGATVVGDESRAEAGLRAPQRCTIQADGGGTWGSILSMCVQIYGSRMYFGVSKVDAKTGADGGPFLHPGQMVLEVQSLDDLLNDVRPRQKTMTVNQSPGSPDYVVTFTDSVDDADHSNFKDVGWPRYYSARFTPSDIGGDAYTGPLMITNNWWDFDLPKQATTRRGRILGHRGGGPGVALASWIWHRRNARIARVATAVHFLPAKDETPAPP
jgi:hypothetical protein